MPLHVPHGRLSCGAASRRPRGPPGIREQMEAPLEGTWEIVYKEAVAQRRPHARRRSQAPDPRVPAVRRQAHKVQHHLVACREERAGRKSRTHAAPQGEE